MRLISLMGLVLAGCASTAPLHSGVITDTSRKIKAGEIVSYKLGPGRYHLELTSSDDGVKVEWLGGACSHARLVKQLNTDCDVTQAGQLIVENPADISLGDFDFGRSVNVTIRLVKRASKE